MNKIKIALNFLLTNRGLSEKEKLDLLTESWRVTYRAKPPTPEEFISEKYLGPVASTLYPRVKETFLNFMNPNTEYRNLILYPHISWGKSFLSTITTLYITTHLSLMRSIYKYFGLSPATQFSQMLISYSLKKSSEVLVAPYLNILEASPFFEKVSRREAMAEKITEFDKKGTVDKLYYTTASKDKSSVFEFDSGLTIKAASSPQSLLGLTITSIVYSELSFFTDAGKALQYGEKVLMGDGSSKRIEDIETGDILFHPTLGTTEVEKIMWEGEDDTYEIEVEDGRTVRCNSKHLWPVEFYLNGVYYDTVVETQFMIDNPQIEFNIKSI